MTSRRTRRTTATTSNHRWKRSRRGCERSARSWRDSSSGPRRLHGAGAFLRPAPLAARLGRAVDDELTSRANVHVSVERDPVHVARAHFNVGEVCTLV